MKNLLSLVIAGMIGGVMVLGVQNIFINKNEIQYQPTEKSNVVLTSYSNNPLTKSIDFVKSSAVSTPAVVHIKVEESDQLAQTRADEMRRQRQNNPYSDFFGGGFFDDFLGQNFHKQQGSGSGVIISKDGYIVTNNHVAGIGDKLSITLADGRKFSAKKIGSDPNSDLAVIKIEGNNYPFVQFGNSDRVKVGEWVLAVGNPFDYLTSTVTAGIVSAKGRDIDIIKGNKPIEEFIQTDAVVNPGNSGGALVDLDGNLIGINTAIATPTGVYAGYSFAIPSNIVKRIVGEIIENGDIERANLGIYINDVSDMINENIDLASDSGVYIDEVINGSSAEFAGLLPGDIIINVEGKKIKDSDELMEVIKFIKIGDTVNVSVLRNGAKQTFNVKLRKGV